MHRRLLIALSAVGASLLFASSALAVTPSGQGPVNGKKCGEPVGWAIQGGLPVEIVTTNETQFVVPTIPHVGTFTFTTCADKLPSSAKAKVFAIKSGTCLQFNPLAPTGTFVKGSNIVIVTGKFFGTGGSFSATCRSLIPSS